MWDYLYKCRLAAPRKVPKPDPAGDSSCPASFLPWWDDEAERRTFDLIKGLIGIWCPSGQAVMHRAFPQIV
jgi:hypothetical protein